MLELRIGSMGSTASVIRPLIIYGQLRDVRSVSSTDVTRQTR